MRAGWDGSGGVDQEEARQDLGTSVGPESSLLQGCQEQAGGVLID